MCAPGQLYEFVGEITDRAQLHGLLTRVCDLGLELEQVSSLAEETARRPGPERCQDEVA